MRDLISVAILTTALGLPVNLAVVEVAQAQSIQSQQNEADQLLEKGTQLSKVSRYSESFAAYEQALTIYRKIKDRYGEATAIMNPGIGYDNLGQHQKAIALYNQALAIYLELKDREGVSKAFGNLGDAYYNLGQFQKAVDFHQQSLEIKKQLGDRNAQSISFNGLGNAYQALGQFQKAIDLHHQSLAIKKQLGDRLGEARSLNNIANVYYDYGQYQKAVEFYGQSVAIKKQVGDLNGEARSLNGIANVYDRLGQYQKSLEFYQKSLKIAKQLGDLRTESSALNGSGNIYANLGQYQKAIELYEQSLVIKRQIGDRAGLSRSLNNLGNASKSLKQYQKAIEFYQQSLSINKEIGDRSSEAISLMSLGIAYDLQKEYPKATDFYQQALAIAQQIGDRNTQASSLGNLGTVAYSVGDLDKALDFSIQAVSIYKQTGNRDGESLSFSNLGNTFFRLNQPEFAILFYKQSINVRESIRKDIRGLSKQDQASYLETVASTYKNLAGLLLKQGRIMEALQVLDLLKVQELEDYLKNIKGSDRTAQGVKLLEPEKAISSQLLAISNEKTSELNRQLASQIQQLPKSEINKVPDYLQKIPQGTVLLYPLILGDRLEIILFSPNSLPTSRTVNISKDKLETLVKEFREALIDEGSEDYREPAAALHNLLIKPIEADLVQAQAKTILYAPDGILRYIPLAALYDGKQWLSEKYRVSNLIAYTLSDFSPKPKLSPNILAGAFGGKRGEKKFGQQSLPATLKEVEAIASYFPNSVTLLENAFSRKATEDKFKNHNVLHFATHAEFNTGAPDNSYIIFGNGDKIRLSELTDWQIPNVELIVLSACQTGVGKLGTGVEILGFGYQVQKVGAKNAIASLWSVDDAGTQALMEAFYKDLKKGDISPTEALNRAQISLIKSSKFSHPKYWSAFFAIGNGL